MNAVEYCATYLAGQGVRRVYGSPGRHTHDLIEALHRAGIRFVPTHHETPAGYMAMVEGQLTRTPGVCLVNQGPCSTNVATAVASAALDRLPLVVLSASSIPDSDVASSHQTFPMLAAFEPIAKWALELKAGNLSRVLPSAFEAARTPRLGPVFLKFSATERLREVDLRPVPFQPPLPVEDAGQDTALELASARLREARRPAIVAGMGVVEADASAPLTRLAEGLGAPIAVTPRAKGQFPEDRPLFAGVLGAAGEQALYDLLDGADLLLLAGLDGVEIRDPKPFKALTISLATVGADDPVYRPAIPINGELKSGLEALAAGARTRSGWKPEEVRACRERIAQALAPPENGGLAPQTVVKMMREEMPRDTVAAFDVGAHGGLFCQTWMSYGPDSFLATTGFSSTGFALPAAMAAKIVHPDRPVLCATGHSGFLTYAGELLTLSRLGLDITVVVMADRHLASAGMDPRPGKVAVSGADSVHPDYVSMARGFGVEAIQASDAMELRSALRRSLASGGPFLIEAEVNHPDHR